MKRVISVFIVLCLLFASPSIVAYAAKYNTILVTSQSGANYKVKFSGNDITTAFEDALCFTKNNAKLNDMCTINVPSGNYNVTYPLTLTSYTTINMASDTVLYNANSGIGNVFISPSYGKIGGYNLLSYCTINGGTVTYAKTNKHKSCLVRIAHANNVCLSNVKFTNNYYSHYVECAACNNLTVDSCSFLDQTSNIADNGSEALQIDVLEESTHFSCYPPYDGTMNQNITVQNCLFKNVERGIGTHSLYAGYYQNNIKILNNTFTNVKSTAIVCSNFTNCIIDGNNLTACGEGIKFYAIRYKDNLKNTLVMNGSKIATDFNSYITNNSINVASNKRTNVAFGILAYGANIAKNNKYGIPAGNYYVGNLTISNNSIITDGYGVYLYDTKSSKITNNTITGSTKKHNAIYAASGSNKNTISGNVATGFDYGIQLNNVSSNIVDGNDVSATKKDGIYINKNSSCTVSNNSVDLAGGFGINFVNSTCKNVLSNTVTSSAKDGIHLDKSSTVTNLNGNSSSYCKKNGFSFAGKITNFNSNVATNNSSNGMYLSSTASVSKLTNNSFTNNKGSGINSNGVCSNISSNNFELNTSYAYYFGKTASANIYSNTLNSNKKGSGYSLGTNKSYSFAKLATPVAKYKTISSGAVISWSKVSNATYYLIYRSDNATGTYTKIATVSSDNLKYTDSSVVAGKTYYYKVRAMRTVNKINIYSAYSNICSE